MSHDEKTVQPATNEERERQSDRKTWVAPTVSDSPVNDLTSNAQPLPGVFDSLTYS